MKQSQTPAIASFRCAPFAADIVYLILQDYLNGYSFDVPEMEVVVMMLRLAEDKETQESIAMWLKKYSIKS